MKIKNSLNAHLFPYHGKTFTMPSQTIPDQTMSIKEILNRYARGIPMDAKTPIWDDNADENDVLPDPRTLDLAERQLFADEARRELEQVKQKIADKRKKKIVIEPEIVTPPAQLEN